VLLVAVIAAAMNGNAPVAGVVFRLWSQYTRPLESRTTEPGALFRQAHV
jgi:hypothetical protein